MRRTLMFLAAVWFVTAISQAAGVRFEADHRFAGDIAACEALAGTQLDHCTCANEAFSRYRDAILQIPFRADDDHYAFHSEEDRTDHFQAGLARHTQHLGCAAFGDLAN